MKNAPRPVKIQRTAAAVTFLLLLAGFAVLYFTFGKQLLDLVKDADSFKQWLSRFGGFDKAVFVAVRAVQTVIKIIPAEPLEIGSGYAWGTWGGLGLCLLGTEIGSLIILLITRFLGVKAVRLFVPEEKLNSLSFLNDREKLVPTLFLLYLIPSTPKDLFTYFAGITKLNIPFFLFYTGIARIPSIITSTWCGRSLGEDSYLKSAIIFSVTAVCGIVGSVIFKKISDKRKAEKTAA